MAAPEKKPIPKLRSRQRILHYVLSFCISYRHEEGRHSIQTSGGIDGFLSAWGDRPALPGDLVRLSSAGVSEWTLSWLIQTREQPGGPEFLCESIETGELCWWSNVSISFLNRPSVDPAWRWTDEQWEFNDRWERVCYKGKGAYIVRPVRPVFGENREVTLGTRTMHGIDDILPTRSFPDWRRVTKAMMGQCYDDCVAERARLLEEAKAQKETPPS